MNASFAEVIQVAAAALGAILIFTKSLPDALKNLQVAKKRGRNGIGEKNVRIEKICLFIQLTLAIIGLWTWFTAPPPYLPDNLIDPSMTFTPAELTQIIRDNRHAVLAKKVAMTAVSIAILYMSYMNWMDVQEVRRDDKVLTSDPIREDSAVVAGVPGEAMDASPIPSSAVPENPDVTKP